MYVSPPTDNSCCGFVLAIPTLDAVMKLVVVFINCKVSVVEFPVSDTPCKFKPIPLSTTSFVVTS